MTSAKWSEVDPSAGASRGLGVFCCLGLLAALLLLNWVTNSAGAFYLDDNDKLSKICQ